MAGRDFLAPARDSASGPTPHHRRSAVVDAYYALMLEGRDALFRWGRTLPPRANVHAWVRLCFAYAADSGLKAIGSRLDRLVRLRNLASYDQSPLAEFAAKVTAQDAIQDAADGIALLDAIEGDPARLVAAIASLPP